MDCLLRHRARDTAIIEGELFCSDGLWGVNIQPEKYCPGSVEPASWQEAFI